MRSKIVVVAAMLAGLGSLPVATAQTRASFTPPYGGHCPQGLSSLYQPVPAGLTLPAGTLITVRTTHLLSSDENRAGDAFETELEQPLIAQGRLIARLGQRVDGRITVACPSSHVQGVSELAIELTDLVLSDCEQLSVRTELVQGYTSSARSRDAVAGATGFGTVIGAASEGGGGSTIQAAIGATPDAVGVLSTRGRATELYPETVLTFRLEDPATIASRQSEQAFQSVTPQYYNDTVAGPNSRRHQTADSYLPPPPYCYPPDYWGGYTPPGYYGFDAYGYGPGFFLLPRLLIGRGFHRHR